MPTIADRVTLQIDCPNCGKTTYQTLRRLRRYRRFRCADCGRTIILTADGLDTMEAALREFERQTESVRFIVGG